MMTECAESKIEQRLSFISSVMGMMDTPLIISRYVAMAEQAQWNAMHRPEGVTTDYRAECEMFLTVAATLCRVMAV